MIAISGVYLNVNMYNFINVIIKESFINFMILKDFIFMVLNIQNICSLTSLIFFVLSGSGVIIREAKKNNRHQLNKQIVHKLYKKWPKNLV